jgi:hypothetical protein
LVTQDAIIAIKVAIAIAVKAPVAREENHVAIASVNTVSDARPSRPAIIPAAITRVVTIHEYATFPI